MVEHELANLEQNVVDITKKRKRDHKNIGPNVGESSISSHNRDDELKGWLNFGVAVCWNIHLNEHSSSYSECQPQMEVGFIPLKN